MGYFRWFANFIFVASPWFLFSLVMFVFNLVFNIWLNDFWADGNAILIFNTVYLGVQTMLSWPLIYEIPLYINQLRFLRTFSVTIAVMYMMAYVFILLNWLYELYLEPEKTYEQYDLFDIFINMFLAYNVVFNIHILPVNFMILLKEVTLWIFPPMLEQNTDEELTIDDAKDTVSPNSYLDIFTGKLPDQENAYNIDKKYPGYNHQ